MNVASGVKGFLSVDLVERFWAKVDKTTSCWIWNGARVNGGYGHFRPYSRKTRMMLAHRAAWSLAYGDIPKGLCVLHLCDTAACVRPDHLFLGTQLDNIRDMQRKGRIRVPFGSAHVFAKLTESAVPIIRRAHSDGVTITELARRFGVGRTTIWQCVTGQTWRHVSGMVRR